MTDKIAKWIASNRPKWTLASDTIRMTIAVISASLIQMAIVTLFVDWISWLPEETRNTPVDLFLGFFLYSVCYVILSQIAFGKLSSDELRKKLKGSKPADRGPFQAFLYGESGTSHATMFSFLALASVGIVAIGPADGSSRFDTIVYASSLLTVVGSWVSNVASFAVQYAREDADSEKPDFGFPDTDEPIWSDYVYTAVMVSASLSTGDVTIRSRARRKLVAINTVIAFTFNTVIIAMLIAAVM